MGLYDCALLYFTFVTFPRDLFVYANYAKNVGVSARLHKVGGGVQALGQYDRLKMEAMNQHNQLANVGTAIKRGMG